MKTFISSVSVCVARPVLLAPCSVLSISSLYLDVMAKDFLTVKQQLVGRFTNFFRSLLKSNSKEICVVANMVGRCSQSTTGGNLARIQRETGQDPWKEPAWKIRDGIAREEVPPQEGYRVQYLRKLLAARTELRSKALETTEVDGLIESLCSS